MMQHIHDVRATHPRWIVETRLVEPARLQVSDALVGPLLHLVLGAEHNGLGRASLLARGSLSNSNTIRAQRAFVGLVIDLGDARDVERASLHAIAAADAVLVDEIHDAVGILHDGTGRGAGLEAARILAVHAAVLADQPLEVAGTRVLVFGVTHQRPAVGRQIVRVVVHTHVDPNLLAQIVPLEACRLAGLAADALRHIDQLGDLGLPLCWRRDGGSRATNQVSLAKLRSTGLSGGIWKRRKHFLYPPYATGPEMGSISTRNALYSGVCALASPTGGVNELIGEAFLASPMKPKLSGQPM